MYAVETAPAKATVSVKLTKETTSGQIEKECDFVKNLDYLKIRRELKISIIGLQELLRKKSASVKIDNKLLEDVLKLNEIYTNKIELCTSSIKDKVGFKKNISKLSAKLGYKEVKDMSAKEYILWCCDLVRYLTTYTKNYDPDAVHPTDKITLDKLITDSNLSENGVQGVCRHQTAYVMAIFNNFKSDNPKVANVYCTYDRNADHAWNIFYIATDKRIYAAQLDIQQGNEVTEYRFRKWYSNYDYGNTDSWNYSPGVWYYRAGVFLSENKQYTASNKILNEALKQFDRYFPFEEKTKEYIAYNNVCLILESLKKKDTKPK